MINDPMLAVAIRAARRAASVIDDAARDLKRLPTHAKSHSDVAFEASAEAENAIIATLRTAYPDHGIIGKESSAIVSQIEGGTARGGKNAFKWLIDPLDGAANFIHGLGYYAVSVALSFGGEITHSVVLDPVRDELFAAIKGKGAQRNGTSIHTSSCVRLSEALVGTEFPKRTGSKMRTYLPSFNALVMQCGGIRRAGACALDLAYVASGRLDGYWVMSPAASDIAAGALLVKEAGGRVGDFAGGADFLRTNELIASAPGLFSALQQEIATAQG